MCQLSSWDFVSGGGTTTTTDAKIESKGGLSIHIDSVFIGFWAHVSSKFQMQGNLMFSAPSMNTTKVIESIMIEKTKKG